MPRVKKDRLKKELGLMDVYTIATGATLSSGFFLLPGIAAAGAGPALPLSYLIAALLLVPGILTKAELGTAMPRAGGVYFFLDRSMGPLVGTIGGFGTWLSLILKTAFALVGIGAYLSIFLPEIPIAPLAGTFAVIFGVINLLGVKKSGVAQAVLVMGLLLLLLWFTGVGAFQMSAGNFRAFFGAGSRSIIATAGLVVVSYMGITKVASVAEEVKNPERNLPLGMFLGLLTALVVYGLGTSIMVGVITADRLAGDLTPVASVGEILVGRWGAVLMTFGAILAFASVGNSGILSASRYPLAMSRDHLLPRPLRRISRYGTPDNSIYVTVAFILVFVTLLDPTKIAKLASTFQLLIIAMNALAVIVMRESKLDSYDPGYRTPLYPWMPIAGIIAPLWLITWMGWLSMLFSLGVVILGVIWYQVYARKRVARTGAVLHVFERLGRTRDPNLDSELRGILKEKGLRAEDPFDETIAHAHAIDLDHPASFEEVVHTAAEIEAQRLPMSADEITERILEGTRIGATPVTHGVALPHLRIGGISSPHLTIVRALPGIDILFNNPLTDDPEAEVRKVHAVFVLISPKDDPAQHLRILAQIAERVDDPQFTDEWAGAEGEQQMKEILLRDERFLSVNVRKGRPSERLIGKALREIDLPEDCLVALCNRDGKTLVPRGDTIFQDGDRITVIGHPEAIREIEKTYV